MACHPEGVLITPTAAPFDNDRKRRKTNAVYTVKKLSKLATIGRGVYVAPSTLPNAGRGLFAARAFSAGEDITYLEIISVLRQHEVQALRDSGDRGGVLDYAVALPHGVGGLRGTSIAIGINTPIYGKGGASFCNDPRGTTAPNVTLDPVDLDSDNDPADTYHEQPGGRAAHSDAGSDSDSSYDADAPDGSNRRKKKKKKAKRRQPKRRADNSDPPDPVAVTRATALVLRASRDIRIGDELLLNYMAGEPSPAAIAAPSPAYPRPPREWDYDSDEDGGGGGGADPVVSLGLGIPRLDRLALEDIPNGGSSGTDNSMSSSSDSEEEEPRPRVLSLTRRPEMGIIEAPPPGPPTAVPWYVPGNQVVRRQEEFKSK
jgi:hypothetical protein